jgi:phenylacetate-CoA ligase
MFAPKLAFKNLHSFADAQWDFLPPHERDSHLKQMFVAQVDYAKKSNSFWSHRLSQIKGSKFDLQQIPPLQKSQVRALGPFDLTVKEYFPFHTMRQSGGTTGLPVPLYWTKSDWTAAVNSCTRFLDEIRKITPLIAWNGYNQAHAGGPSFDDIIRAIGGFPVARHFRSEDGSAIEEIERFGANVLVLPAQGGSGKGGSLEDLLNQDPSFISRLGIKGVMVSSTELTEEIFVELVDQGIAAVVNLYGSTEAFPAAVSCTTNPFIFHLAQGPNYVEVVDGDGKAVKNGERGRVLVSRIAGEGADGFSPATGSQLLRFVVGDEVTFIDDPCQCGRTTPRIKDIKRIINVEDKIAGGCEKWE